MVVAVTPGAVAPPLALSTWPPWSFQGLVPFHTGTQGVAYTVGTLTRPVAGSQRVPQS